MTTEDVQEVPKWLKELEEKRERRLKARLGHEAGAGSPCLTCEEKCPGLDLHFWRKICKNCKCGKESHDVSDDDIYGWVQFQLLGSKPTKSKNFVLPGRKDAVELDWMPKGVADAVESYLKELPINLLPIKGSPAALERKQLLQKQIPLHDIDPSLCHALTENEVKQMNDYIADVKKNSVGVGRVIKLNEILIANRAPMQIPQMENIVLQGANRTNDLVYKKLNDLKIDELPTLVPNRPLLNENDYQNPAVVKNVVQDRKYSPVLDGRRPGLLSNKPIVDEQNPQIANLCDINYPVLTRTFGDADDMILNNNNMHVPNQAIMTSHIAKQTRFPSGEAQAKHANRNVLNNGAGNVDNLLIPNKLLSNSVDHQYVTNPGHIKDVHYSPSTQNTSPRYLNSNVDSNPSYAPHITYYDDPNINEGNINTGTNHNLNYPASQNQVNDKKLYGNPVNELPVTVDNQTPWNSHIRDIRYPSGEAQALYANQNVLSNCAGNVDNLLIPNKLVANSVDHQYVANPGHIKDVHYSPNTQNTSPRNLSSNVNLDSSYASHNMYCDSHNINEGNINPGSNLNYTTSQNQVNDKKWYGNPVNELGVTIDNQTPKTFPLHDINYPTIFNQTEQNHPRIQNAMPVTSIMSQDSLGNLQIPSSAYQNAIDQQTPVQIQKVRDISYPLNLPEQTSSNDNTTFPNITNIRDLAFSTYNPQPSNNPDEINATPVDVNIGLINDIEYPTLAITNTKSAIHIQNISEPAHPRKNVQFNLIPEEILPSCHKCNKVFDATALVVGIDRSDALWHADCFKCAGCNQNLADLMYFYDKSNDDIYCGRDYAKIRGIPRCQACDELIFVKVYCLAENSTFHVKHFCCFECDVPLAGQNYVMEDLLPLCLPCFEQLKAEKCNTCLKVIKPDEQGANLNGIHFHADGDCFACKICKKPLLGAKLLLKNMSLYCSATCFGADQ